MDSEGLKILASVPRYGVNRRILRPKEEISVLRSSCYSYEDFESQSPQSCTFEVQHPKHHVRQIVEQRYIICLFVRSKVAPSY